MAKVDLLNIKISLRKKDRRKLKLTFSIPSMSSFNKSSRACCKIANATRNINSIPSK